MSLSDRMQIAARGRDKVEVYKNVCSVAKRSSLHTAFPLGVCSKISQPGSQTHHDPFLCVSVRYCSYVFNSPFSQYRVLLSFFLLCFSFFCCVYKKGFDSRAPVKFFLSCFKPFKTWPIEREDWTWIEDGARKYGGSLSERLVLEKCVCKCECERERENADCEIACTWPCVCWQIPWCFCDASPPCGGWINEVGLTWS